MKSGVLAISMAVAVSVASPLCAQQTASEAGAGAPALRSEVSRATARDGIADPSTPEARVALDAAAGCVASASPSVSADLLVMDFRQSAYRQKMDRLIDANVNCVKARWMRSSRLLFAGALAEHLMEAGAEPLNRRLARVASNEPQAARTPSDSAAFCIARSDPDGTTRLFATVPGSAAEAEAAKALAPALGLCARELKAAISPAGIRAMVATASYRLLAEAESRS